MTGGPPHACFLFSLTLLLSILTNSTATRGPILSATLEFLTSLWCVRVRASVFIYHRWGRWRCRRSDLCWRRTCCMALVLSSSLSQTTLATATPSDSPTVSPQHRMSATHTIHTIRVSPPNKHGLLCIPPLLAIHSNLLHCWVALLVSLHYLVALLGCIPLARLHCLVAPLGTSP